MYDNNNNLRELCKSLKIDYSPHQNQNELIKECTHKVKQINKIIKESYLILN
jgi:hypothetical protein